MKQVLQNILDINDTKISKIFNLSLQLLIILSIIAFSIETIPDLQETTKNNLNNFELFSISIFTTEYLARLYIADKKLKYIFSFYGIIDLLSILPFFLTTFLNFQAIKAFRLFRLFRLLKLTRYSKTINKFQKAISKAKEEFIIFFLLTIIMFYLSSIGIYYFENDAQPKAFSSVFDSMWWAVATLTTVGYGDIYPITIGGKIFTTIMLLIGLGIVGIPAGIVAAALSEVTKEDQDTDLDNNKD